MEKIQDLLDEHARHIIEDRFSPFVI
jgi:hypothetical protein